MNLAEIALRAGKDPAPIIRVPHRRSRVSNAAFQKMSDAPPI